MVFKKARGWHEEEGAIFWMRHCWKDKKGGEKQLPAGVVGILKIIDKNSSMQWNWRSTISFQSGKIYSHFLVGFALPVSWALGSLALDNSQPLCHGGHSLLVHLPGVKVIMSSTRNNI